MCPCAHVRSRGTRTAVRHPGPLAIVAFVIGACDAPTSDAEAHALQGVVEFEERTLAFEVAGRIAEVAVREGDAVEPGMALARLDDALERLERDARAAEARA
ncbi:MAG: biotin/lipoyl-binding protein, partial [Deltaproteobacteria bacterium]